jgi:hypothetical protein
MKQSIGKRLEALDARHRKARPDGNWWPLVLEYLSEPFEPALFELAERMKGDRMTESDRDLLARVDSVIAPLEDANAADYILTLARFIAEI